MTFEGMEITQEEYDKWPGSWPIDLIRERVPGMPAWDIWVSSMKQQIIRERKQAAIPALGSCLQFYANESMKTDQNIEPNLDDIPAGLDLHVTAVDNWLKDKVIEFFRRELYHSDGKIIKPYWIDRNIDAIPPFENLNPRARLAFYIEWHKLKRKYML